MKKPLVILGSSQSDGATRKLVDLIFEVKLREDLTKRFPEKTLYLISCSDDNDLPDGFVMPFENTAGYLNMKFGGSMHGWQKQQVYSEEAVEVIEKFRASFT